MKDVRPPSVVGNPVSSHYCSAADSTLLIDETPLPASENGYRNLHFGNLGFSQNGDFGENSSQSLRFGGQSSQQGDALMSLWIGALLGRSVSASLWKKIFKKMYFEEKMTLIVLT